MKLPQRLINHLRHLLQVVGLAILILGSSLVVLQDFTDKLSKIPISVAPVQAEAPIISSSVAANPVASAFINAIPDANGAEVFVAVTGVNAGQSQIVLNIDPGSGGGNHRGGYAMTLSGTTHVATAIGFTPGQDTGVDGDDTMSITTTVGSEVMSTGDINFQRAFVKTNEIKTISVDNGAFELKFLNTDSVPVDTYVLVMSTNKPPAGLPIGYQFVGSTYNIRPSGSLTQSDKSMTLNLSFTEPLPNGRDPRTLAIVAWDAFNQRWDVLGGDLLDDDNKLTIGTRRFTIYALATTSTWRDTFQEFSLPGVFTRTNTSQGAGQTIVLNAGAITGTVTSIPITPTNAAAWGTLSFSATTTLSNNLTVDILDINHTPVLTNISDGVDLSGLSLSTHPILHLRVTLTRTIPTADSPKLHEWQVNWMPVIHDIYLPVVLK